MASHNRRAEAVNTAWGEPTPNLTLVPTLTPTAGTGTVADAPSTPSPVAQGPAVPAGTGSAPVPSKTPEHVV
ncbi:hypothetical protein ACIQPR_18525 [Streptomyces sp. NPDC091280]|uniref:hypothetical protein n=1 Tax=Streptomyces sp. NPDC091280 TaxID=3365984 RepID=UPI0038234434